MAFDIDSIASVPAANVAAAERLFASLLLAEDPNREVQHGAFHDVVLSPTAQLHAITRLYAARLLRSSSLQAITEDPALAADALVDRLLDNYRLVRQEAVEASGSVVLIFSAQTPQTIPTTAVLTSATGIEFNPAATYRLVISADLVLTDTDLYLEPRGDGTYRCIIQVVAVVAGANGNLAYNSGLSIDPEPTSLQSAFASAGFTGGRDADTNADLIARLPTSWAARTVATPAGIGAILDDAIPDFRRTYSVVGFGRAELTRGISGLAVSLPGRTDVWVRTADLPTEVSGVLTAVYQAPSSSVSVWRLVIPRDFAPGFYSIARVTKEAEAADPDTTGYTISSTTALFDTTEGETPSLLYIPDIATTQDAAYSRYTSAAIVFTDSDTPNDGLVADVSTMDYAVAVLALPGILDAQEAVSDPNQAGVAGDCLIRAAVRVDVTAEIDIDAGPSGEVDEAAVQAAAAAAVNATGFGLTLNVAIVAAAAQAAIPDGSLVTSTELAGVLTATDGSTTVISASTTALVVTGDDEINVSERTVCFFLHPDDVTVNVT